MPDKICESNAIQANSGAARAYKTGVRDLEPPKVLLTKVNPDALAWNGGGPAHPKKITSFLIRAVNLQANAEMVVDWA